MCRRAAQSRPDARVIQSYRNYGDLNVPYPRPMVFRQINKIFKWAPSLIAEFARSHWARDLALISPTIRFLVHWIEVKRPRPHSRWFEQKIAPSPTYLRSGPDKFQIIVTFLETFSENITVEFRVVFRLPSASGRSFSISKTLDTAGLSDGGNSWCQSRAQSQIQST